MAQGQWYWCLTHHAVEPYEACRNENRLGPYDTEAEAAQALSKVAERNDAYDHDARYVDLDETGEPEPEPKEGWGPFSG